MTFLNYFLNKTIFFKKLDLGIIIFIIILTGIGIVSLYSFSRASGDFLYFQKQIIFLIIGGFLMTIMALFDYRILKNNSYLVLILYAISLISLVGLFIFASPIRGVKSWYKIGDFSIDPAEFSKLVLIIILAKYFSYRHVELYKLRHIIFSGVYMIAPVALIYLQPNLGSALILIFIWFGILIVSGIRLRHFLILLLLAIIIFYLGWSFFLKDYQKERIISFLMPDYKPLEIGWNQRQAKIALGSGGWFGKGMSMGSQTQYGFLPEPKTDFIFAAIGEEFGFLAILATLILFFILFLKIIRVAFMADNNFSRLFALGLLVWIFSHFLVNIGSNIGIVPVIGLPLPFVSYGGSSLITMFLAIGILQSSIMRSRKSK